MIRVIVRVDDGAGVLYLGSALDTKYKTFDVELPEVEAYLRSNAPQQGSYVTVSVGVEVLEPNKQKQERAE